MDTACHPCRDAATWLGEACWEPGVGHGRWTEKMSSNVFPHELSCRVCARTGVCASSRGSENDWRRKAAGAPGEGGRAWGTRGAVPSHPLVLLPVTPPAREGVRGAVGETAKRCLRNRIKVLGSWCASTQPAPSFRAALRRASGVLTLVIGLVSGGGGWRGGFGLAALNATPMTTPGGRRDAGARVRLRKTAGAGRLAACICVTLWHAEAALGLPASRRGVGLAQGPEKRGPQSR